jgi:hypothetical protein
VALPASPSVVSPVLLFAALPASPFAVLLVQQKEFAATPTPLGIEDEEEVTYQSAPITQQPAMHLFAALPASPFAVLLALLFVFVA